MSGNKLADLANYKEKESEVFDCRTNKAQQLKKAISTLIKEFNIKNGSLKIFVHNGQPGERIEIQSKVITKY